MNTEDIKTAPAPQPEIFISDGSYYIMDRREKKHDTHDASEELSEDNAPPISSRHKRNDYDTGAAGYLLLAILGAAAGVAVALLYPVKGGVILPESKAFLEALTDRLLQCGGFLLAEYLLGYFAAGALLVWMIPPIYGLGAGLTAAAYAMSGSYLNALTLAVYTIVISAAAHRSAEFSSMLLSVATGRSGVLTDGTVGSSYTVRFFFYLLAVLAAAIPEALIVTAG